MNENLILECLKDVVLEDATKRVLGNILTQFEDLSGEDHNKLVDINMDFLGNHIPNIANISITSPDIEGFRYEIGRAKFNKEILENVCSEMKGKWVISVDESIIDQESFVRNVAYRHSCAFGYKIPEAQNPPDEGVLAVSSILRLQDDEHFDNKMQFLPYLLNLYVAFYTAKILQGLGEPIFAVILHGPLIRMIAPFLKLLFEKDVIQRVVTADTVPPIQIDKITNELKDEIKGIASGKLLDLITEDEDYKSSVELFLDLFEAKEKERIGKIINEERQIPGICFYFSLLKKLSDLASDMDFQLIGCVDKASSTEYSSLFMQYQIELFGKDSSQQKILNKLYKTVESEDFTTLIKKSGWDDEMLQSFSLKFDRHSIESEFTLPVPIRRYFPAGTNKSIFNVSFGSTSYRHNPAQERMLNGIIDNLFPFNKYRMLMSFVRTSELKAPIRVEFLEIGNKDNWHQVLASIYVFSLPYSSYGLPIFLYYADKMARTPKKIIASVTKNYMFEQVKRTLHRLDPINFTQVCLAATQKLRRDFYDR